MLVELICSNRSRNLWKETLFSCSLWAPRVGLRSRGCQEYWSFVTEGLVGLCSQLCPSNAVLERMHRRLSLDFSSLAR